LSKRKGAVLLHRPLAFIENAAAIPTRISTAYGDCGDALYLTISFLGIWVFEIVELFDGRNGP